MPDLYDEAIERLAYLRIYGWVSEEDAKALTIDVLDAVAPAISSRAAARALREAADEFPKRTQLQTQHWLRSRADEIEGKA